MSDETRNKRVVVSLTPSLLARLESYAAEHRWKLSTAVYALVEDGLDAAEREQPRRGKAGAR